MLDNIDDITLFELNLFAEIGKRQSLRSIARGKSLRASHVSKALARLERKLKRQLVRRSASGVVLTPDGERLLDLVRPLVEQAERLRGESPMGATEAEKPLVTLGAVRFICERLLAPAVRDLESGLSPMRFRLLDFSPDQVVAAGLRGAFEAAVSFDPTPWTKAWDVTPLGEMRWRLYGRADHPLGRRVPVEDVKRFPFLVPNYWRNDGFERGDDYCPLPLHERLCGHEASSILTALEIVEVSDHLVFAPEIACRRAVAEKRLQPIAVSGWRRVSKAVYLVVKADVVAKRLQERLLAALGAQLAEP